MANRPSLVDEGAESDFLSAEHMEAMVGFESAVARTPDEQALADDFQEFFASIGSRHFSAEEFLFLGAQHGGNGDCAGKNSLPERQLWPNVKPLVLALDALRARLACPVYLTCVYRNPEYNRCVGGVDGSQHRNFTAADCVFKGSDVRDCAGIARQLRSDGVFSGGVGLYRSFVHIDVRGTDADWSSE